MHALRQAGALSPAQAEPSAGDPRSGDWMSGGQARGPTEALEYIHAMLSQLRAMAQGEGHEMLAYLIDMAALEASEAMRPRLESSRKD